MTIDVSLEAQSGLGAGVDLLWIDIESDGAIRTEAAKTPAPPVITAPAVQQPIRVSASKTIYLSEGQPLQIIDSQGRVLQTIYLKSAH